MARRYSAEDVANVLAVYDANGKNMAKTSRETGVPRSTLRRWIDGMESGPDDAMRQDKRDELTDLLEQWLRLSLGHIVNFHEKFGDMPTAETMKAAQVGAGIATDKLLALRDELPTERQESDTVIRIVREDRMPEVADD